MTDPGFGWIMACIGTAILLAWYAITAELFGRTFYLTCAVYGPAPVPQWACTLLSSALVTATTVFGFRAMALTLAHST